MKIPPPQPHPYDGLYQSLIDELAKRGYPDVHYYVGRGNFKLGNSTHLFRVVSWWESHWQTGKNYSTHIEAAHIFKRKSKPFLPFDAVEVRHRFNKHGHYINPQ